ncbi:MAG: hypothetical protein R3E96_01500, partial [Planctomycetota bacterium]
MRTKALWCPSLCLRFATIFCLTPALVLAQEAPDAAKKTIETQAQGDSANPTPNGDGFPSLSDIVVSADEGVPVSYPGGRDQIDQETLDMYAD